MKKKLRKNRNLRSSLGNYPILFISLQEYNHGFFNNQLVSTLKATTKNQNSP